MASDSRARLRALLGDLDDLEDGAASGWAEGYGVVSPDVTRYIDVLRAVPDAVLLAMRNIADAEGVELVDADTATLVGLLARLQRPERVLELGTGVGYLTVHVARAVSEDCTITSIEPDPIRHGQAHAFLERDAPDCALELRLGDPRRLLREPALRQPWNLVLLGDPALPRLELLDEVAGMLAPGALVAIPFALRGGRVADGMRGWEEAPEVDAQRTLNRCVAMDPRFTDVALLPVGDGLLLARRR